MNILVIGNGFDLAHGLPTKYTDFLNFINEFAQYYGISKRLFHKNKSNLKVKQYIDNLYLFSSDSMAKKLIKEIEELIKDNVWIKHFNGVQIKEGWVDFESEISKIIQVMDEIRLTIQNEKSKKIKLKLYQRIILKHFNIKTKNVKLDDLLKIKNKCIYDLERLTRCLEIYLSDYVNNYPVNFKIHDIKNIKIDKILSFNYTNTYERIYNANGEHQIEYDFIHGKANIFNTVSSCNLVLGIDEYLQGEDRDNDNEYIQFKKFYQRIYKKTGCAYINWLNHIQELNIYIYGHSLDITDKDILEKLINLEKAKITVFYHNKAALEKQIINLVKVIGQDKLIQKAYNENPSIIFKEKFQFKKE